MTNDSVDNVGLVHLGAIERTLAEAKSLAEIIGVRHSAEAARQCFRLASYGLQMQNEAAELKLRAERRAGEMLAGMDLDEGGRPAKTGNIVLPVCDTPSLADLGLTKIQSHRWQQEATVPQETFERHVAEVKQAGEELTTAGVLRLARRLTKRIYTEMPPPPAGMYRCLVIDPPWPVKKIEREVRPNQVDLLDYPVMTVDQIKDLKVQNWADPMGCHIYLWTTQRFLRAAFEVFDVWNVSYQCLLTWVKNVGFTPYSWMYSTEHVLFGRIGNLALLRNGLRLDFAAKVREHSRKPDEFYRLVSQASPEPRLDVFSRESHEGFEQWGDETNVFPKHV